jgi:predicted alpha/beta-fold hydrolase
LRRRRERFLTDDGDFFDVDWFGSADAPVVILLHGLAGCSGSSYILGLQQVLGKKGFQSVAINFRGCSGEPNRKAIGYHAGFTRDLNQLYWHIKEQSPTLPVAVVGFSLGGNILLKWLGEQRERLDLLAAVAVSVPFKLSMCADRLDSGLSKIYRDYLIKLLKQSLLRKQSYLFSIGEESEARKIDQLGDFSTIRSFWEFDDRVVARLNGFCDVYDYYSQSSSFHYLEKISETTLLIQADNDPFMLPDVNSISDCLSSSTELEITRGGGHVGFISTDSLQGGNYWLEKRIPTFLIEQLITHRA